MSTTTERPTEASVAEQKASGSERSGPELVETPPSRRDRVLTWALPLVALCVLAAGALTWWRATGHDQEMVDEAARRDRVLIVATSHIETLNSLDYRKVDEGLKGWAAVTTGTLHDQLTSVSEEDRKVLAEQEKISTGSVMDAAVTELDDDSATVIAAVEITVRDGSTSGEEAEPTVKRNRFAADLVKVGDDWLLESLEQVAVNMS